MRRRDVFPCLGWEAETADGDTLLFGPISALLLIYYVKPRGNENHFSTIVFLGSEGRYEAG